MTNLIYEIIFYGLFAGALYALVVAGYSLVYSILGFVNFAHGEMMTIGVYLCWFFTSSFLKFSLIAGMISAILFTGIISFVFGYFLLVPARNRSSATALIVAIGLSIIIQNLVALIFQADAKAFIPFESDNSIEFFGIQVKFIHFFSLISSFFLLGFLWYFLLKRTKLGLEIRACASNPFAGYIHGLRRNYVFGIIFFISGMLAALAGIAVGMDNRVLTPLMGFNFGIRAFIASVIGGMNNFRGAIAGAFILGITENLFFSIIISLPLFKPLIPLASKDVIALLIMVCILIWKPSGIFSKKTENRP